MKNIFILILITISLTVNGQNKNELEFIMNDYAENYGKPNYGEKFVIEKLNPTILEVERFTCESKDMGLLDIFLKMISKTKGSTDELQADVLAGMFICKSESIQKYIEQIYTEKYFKEMLELGFKNRTHNKQSEIVNYSFLKKRLEYLIKTE